MSKCIVWKPLDKVPSAGMFVPEDLQYLSAEWLGDDCISPSGSFQYRVTSVPLCRLYWEGGKPEPNVNESAYFQDERGRWKRSHSNYLSYQVADGSFVTVRWEAPGQQNIVPNKNDIQSAA